MTDTELNDIARAAATGLRSTPKNGTGWFCAPSARKPAAGQQF
jgi:hypothetical protein